MVSNRLAGAPVVEIDADFLNRSGTPIKVYAGDSLQMRLNGGGGWVSKEQVTLTGWVQNGALIGLDGYQQVTRTGWVRTGAFKWFVWVG